MHGVVFFLDCLFARAMKKGLDFESLLSQRSSDTHQHSANQLLRCLSCPLLYKFFGGEKKSPQKNSQKAILGYHGVQKLPYVHGMFLSNT